MDALEYMVESTYISFYTLSYTINPLLLNDGYVQYLPKDPSRFNTYRSWLKSCRSAVLRRDCC